MWFEQTKRGRRKPLVVYKRQVTKEMLQPGAFTGFE
jgi:hypothetical protein